MQNLRVFTLGNMKPEGDADRDDTRFVRQTHTTQLANIIKGAAEDLARMREIESPDTIEVAAPEDSNRSDIVGAVLSAVENSDLLIVDVSTESPSVIYELGAVNALGLPYILVTSQGSLPFYLTQTRGILNFAFANQYDASEPSHRDLRNRLLRNYQSPDGTEATESRFSEYFGGLPIVNISGPVSIATGYQANFLNRFGAQDHGLLSREIVWAKGGRAEEQIEEVAKVRPRHLLVVIPDLNRNSDYNDARYACEAAMRSAGLALESVSVLEEPGRNQRLGMGVLIVKEHPEIVLDIPRTLFPLMKSPRILTALKNGKGFSDSEVRERTTRRLLRDFRAALEWNLGIARQGSDAPWRRVHIVNQKDLVEKVSALIAEGSNA